MTSTPQKFCLERPKIQTERLSELSRRMVSGSIETDLIAAAVETAKFGSTQTQIAPSFKQAEGDIFERAETFGESIAKEAPLFHELKD